MDTLKQITYFVIPLLGTVWFINFCLVSYYRYREEKLHKELDKKIEDIRKQVVPMSFIGGNIKLLEEQYKQKFEELERKKQFLRDIIPFFKSN